MHRLTSSPILKLVLAILLFLALPDGVFAHGGSEHEASAMAGSLAWGFLGFGVVVISAVSFILFAGNAQSKRAVSAADFEGLSGFGGYIAKIRLFSRNARLFMIHVVGMDVIYGTWSVLFNLYLLAVGFDIAFIGLRLLLASITRALLAIPAGLISDRVGRKLSFVLGDGGGAVMSLIAISTGDATLLLVTAVLGGAFGSIHGVAEPAFMAENSEDFERVHLFSVSSGTRTAAAIIGSALAGLIPLLFAGSGTLQEQIGLYRTVAYIGIGGWFASLIPAVMLTQVVKARVEIRGLRSLFAGVKNPGLIWKLTIPEAVIALGAGFTLPLMNVFFKQNLGSPEVEIGATFAAGEAFLVVGAFLAPLAVSRFGKVKSVVITRLLAIPFILLIAFSPDVGAAFGSVFTIAGLAYIARITFSNMASPVRSAFAMEILDPGERGTQVGIEMALASALSGLASYVGAQLMELGDFRSPFIFMAGLYLIANLIFWHFFSRQEQRPVSVPAADGLETAFLGADAGGSAAATPMGD
ncbi:MAG TPA: MFS transporter [Anaerolineae bacterium]|nr:MFS transporter [Anaerolineae bacterium]